MSFWKNIRSNIGQGHKDKIAAVMLSLLLLLTGCGDSATDVEHLQLAKEYHDAGNLDAELIELKNALKKNPDNVEARWLLGKAYIRAEEGAAAEKELRRAVELGIDNQAVIVPLAHSLVLQRRFQEAIDTIADAGNLPSRELAKLLAVRGRALLGLEQVEQAKESFDDALKVNRESIDGILGLALIELEQFNYTAAETLVLNALALEPLHKEANLILGQLNLAQQDYQSAVDAYTTVLEFEPFNLLALLGRAAGNMNLEQYKPALKDVRLSLKLSSRLTDAHFLRAQILYKMKNLEGAKQSAQEVLALVPKHQNANLMLGAINASQRNLNQSRQHFENVIPYALHNVPAVKLFAMTLIRLGEFPYAIELLEGVKARVPEDVQLLTLLGMAYRQSGQFERGEQYFSQAMMLAPETLGIRTELVLSQLAQGKTESAVTQLEELIELDKNMPEADMLLFYAHFNAREQEKALKAAEKAVARNPENPSSHNLLGTAYLTGGDIDKARQSLQKALELDAKYKPAQLNLAQIALNSGVLDEARHYFQSLLGDDQNNQQALLGLARVEAGEGNHSLALEKIQQAWEGNPGALEPGLLLVTNYMGRKDYLKAVSVARELADRYPNNAAVMRGFGVALLSSGEAASAVAPFEKLELVQPQQAEPKYYLALANVHLGATDSADKKLQQAIEIDNTYLPAIRTRINLLAKQKKFPEALALARQQQEIRPKQAVGYQLAGDILAYSGDYKESAVQYRKAHDLEPNEQRAILVSNTLAYAGDMAAAMANIDRWLDVNPDSGAALLLRATLLQRQQRDEEAISEYLRIIKKSPDNYLALNNLALLYVEQDIQRSIQYAERAYKLATSSAGVVDTYGWVLFKSGNTDKALPVLEEAARLAPGSAEIVYHLAVVYEKAGSIEKARRTLSRLISGEKEFPQLQKAKALLAKLEGE